jgi:hypothetical protein
VCLAVRSGGSARGEIEPFYAERECRKEVVVMNKEVLVVFVVYVVVE